MIASAVLFGIIIVLFFALGYIIDSRGLSFSQSSSNSMEPTIYPNDWIILDSKATPKTGDIIIFHCAHKKSVCRNIYGNDRIQHRLISVAPDGCMRIIGDNKTMSNTWNTLPCFPPEDIVIEGVSHKLWF